MKNSTLYSILSALTISVCCLIVLISGWIAFDLPRRAERSFGPASKGLDLFQNLELSARLLLQEDELTKPMTAGGVKQPFRIEPGESTFAITSRLQQSGLIIDAQALRDYLVYAGLDTTLQSGDFDLSPQMTALEIAWALQDPTPNEVTFRVLPGWRLEEIAAALPTSGLEFSPGDFLSVAYNPPAQISYTQQMPEDISLEGYIYPDSYLLPRKTSVLSFIEATLQDFQLKVDDELQEGFQRQGLTLHQAVTLASIIQREAVIEDEMPAIASVFFNRLNAGMKLDTDPTVQYALGKDRESQSWWKNPLSLDDLQVNSPYNTYLNVGLPPGPISNPGLSALRAVAFPAQTPYFYFRSACDGSGRHVFAETFEQHQQNACPE